MAIKLNATYAKRLGLPGYSSHQFSVSIETELVNPDQVAEEAARIYQLLQTNVDEQIQQTGFVPPADYGMDDSPAPNRSYANGNGSNGHDSPNGDKWRCSDKQKELILKLVDELLETHGGGRNGNSRSNGTRRNAYARNGGGR